VVQELDWSTGQVIDKLAELGILDNTLIIFTSDNGPWLSMGDHGGSAGPLRDGKITAFEGGQRVPTIVHWPARIEAGREEDTVVSMVDLLPTFSALVGVPLPSDRIIDGVDITEFLTGEQQLKRQQFFYMAPLSDNIAAYRDGDWKLKLPRSGYPKFLDSILKFNIYSHGLLLFNLQDDPYEQNNIADYHSEIVARMQQAITDMEANIASENPRKLYMGATPSDHKGYGPLMVKAGLLASISLLIATGLLYGTYRLIKAKLTRSH
jgi:arylsulfatase A